MIDKYIGILILILFYGLYERVRALKREPGIKIGYRFPYIPVYLPKEYFHILIAGVTNTGKSRLAEYIVRNKKVVLINTYKEDFTTLVGAKRLNTREEIISFFRCLNNNQEELWLVIDELNTLTQDKELNSMITRILSFGRHQNIRVIGILTRGLTKEVDCKNLFPARICFKCIEESFSRAILGVSVPNDLGFREFYLRSDKIYRCKSYSIGE